MLEGSTRDSGGWWTRSGKAGPGLECPDLLRFGGELMLGGGGGCNQRGRGCPGVERRLWWAQGAHGWRFDEGEDAAWPEQRGRGRSGGLGLLLGWQPEWRGCSSEVPCLRQLSWDDPKVWTYVLQTVLSQQCERNWLYQVPLIVVRKDEALIAREE
ncbi:hypothetical protein KSP39_PZI012132 [Platanthera zijinensis]|uniref:Uncharacterized protein n=1 Tax=Platanthera zijinensis TaxID=2320716 RepID=A0AAP0BEF8_9ASPA